MERISDYDYELPPELIAQEPLPDRSASRLLVLHKSTGEIEHRMFTDAPEYLQSGDLLVLNETTVTAMRLLGHRFPTGGAVEVLLIGERGDGCLKALVRPAKKLPIGSQIIFDNGLLATIREDIGEGQKWVAFTSDSSEGAIEEIKRQAIAPLPPYIHTPLADRERYQTVYHRPSSGGLDGSSAAPTAGLHFTNAILETIRNRGVGISTVNLTVGLDTFRPVQVDHIDDHAMHGEVCALPEETAEQIRRAEGRIIAVGTTTARTLETFIRISGGDRSTIKGGETISKLFLTPADQFRLVSSMFTNFHMPRTTMLMMISTLAGRDFIMRAYAEAVEKKYRFLSFGDSMLIV